MTEIEAAEIIELAKSWANRQLSYVASRPYNIDYPRNNAVRVEAHSQIALGISPYLSPDKSLALLNYVSRQADLAQKDYSPDDDYRFLGYSLVINALRNLVMGYLKIEAYDAAHQTAQLMSHDVQKVEMIAHIADFLVQKERFEEAPQIYTWAEQAANAVENSSFRQEAYSMLFIAALQVKGAEFTVRLSEQVNRQGTAIRPRFYNLVHRLVEMKQIEQAYRVAHFLTSKVDRAKALVQIAAAPVEVQALQNTIILEIEEYLSSTDNPEEQLSFLSSLAIAFYKTGDMQSSTRCFSRASEVAQRTVPQSIPHPIIYYAIALATCGNYDKARAVVRSISSSWVCQEALIELTTFFEGISNYGEAYKTAILIDSKYWQARALIRLAKALQTNGQDESANHLLSEVIVLLNQFDFTSIQPLDNYLVTQMLVRFRRVPEAFHFLDNSGIDEFLKALASAASHFENLCEGQSLKVVKSVMEIAAQKYSDYKPILEFIE